MDNTILLGTVSPKAPDTSKSACSFIYSKSACLHEKPIFYIKVQCYQHSKKKSHAPYTTKLDNPIQNKYVRGTTIRNASTVLRISTQDVIRSVETRRRRKFSIRHTAEKKKSTSSSTASASIRPINAEYNGAALPCLRSGRHASTSPTGMAAGNDDLKAAGEQAPRGPSLSLSLPRLEVPPPG
jgi:hypothetical protein